MTEATTQVRKEAAMDFLRLVASGKVREAYDKYVGAEFRHHNPFFRGDLVAVHSHVLQHPGDRGAAVVHLFRFEGDRVAELWDVGQAVPESSPNELGMF